MNILTLKKYCGTKRQITVALRAGQRVFEMILPSWKGSGYYVKKRYIAHD